MKKEKKAEKKEKEKAKLSDILEEERKNLPSGVPPYDAMNKAMFKHREIIQSFLSNYVDEDFIKDLDLSRIEDLPSEFVSEQMRKRYSDCIKKINWKGEDAYLLLILEFQSTKDIWIPVRILAYTALLWLDLLEQKIPMKDGLPPVFPIVLYSGTEKWNATLSVRNLISPVAHRILKYQPDNLALLVSEHVIQDEVLNKNSDFYALFLELKRAKTPMAMRDAIEKYKEKLADPEHFELLKTVIAVIKTLYKCFNTDADASDIRFSSLEEAVAMIDSIAIDWKKNMRDELYNEWKNEGIDEGKKEVAFAMLQEGFSLKLIEKITKLPLAEIEKLEAQRV